MGFESNFDMNDIIKNHEEFLNNVIESMKEAMIFALIEVVNLAKSTNTYTDRTNNLRSSIGGVVYHGGQMVHSHFETSGKGKKGNGKEGASKGLELAKEKASEVEVDGFVCVVVAGEHYARYVENKGFDVVTGSFLQFGDILEEKLKTVEEVFGIKFNK
ncbi:MULTISPECIES: hypothetical protein [Elizabethkingia]|uniref:Uncharacterized protein n=1 Tax=Elizabethkingia anophelis TaxID=1117645 RepID=A0A494J4C8_9FLAO|nr:MULTISPECIES: hypothetical protein [Elizabethkingia]AQX52537.1 hypothetical protein AYC66_18445 [Elizabethkingia anophelis]EJC8061946.1 hypothetical protein [Elizabethkingia anophelis]EJK5330541.1 hypothetical protein [Elizabethkingia meningoseptica]MCL1640036.1 hypothetical protein [Elizabethkingia anophelis]MCL1646573.1 hypothetical protein [Elizabethkingia anophelis]